MQLAENKYMNKPRRINNCATNISTTSLNRTNINYLAFDKLNGEHPWQKVAPDGCINYPVRELNRGNVTYFNYSLAKDMGLISKDHPNKLTTQLENKIISTFSIRIINEYDQQNKKKYPQESIKPFPYMATRYLQLQHPNKNGKTSGDGRCIWNGTVEFNGKCWDVSSRGTGVTALAPGAVLAGKPLRSGNTEHGYGCGFAEIDELYSSAIMAEILHLEKIETERVLAVIDLGSGYGIGVRASQNLFRPAHFFAYLKQNNYTSLKKTIDYFIQRQIDNKIWSFNAKDEFKYQNMLSEICISFAKFAAKLEREYIFAWLDWDGDNVLANAGIIDYGSVRQFGLRHDQYRYDDVERFSTNLNEQKYKAKQIVQVFIQLVDYLESTNKKCISHFNKHSILKKYDNIFNNEVYFQLLKQIGFKESEITKLLGNHIRIIKKFYIDFEKLEKVKTRNKVKKVPDGINRPAILNMKKYFNYVLECLVKKDFKGLKAEIVFSKIIAKKAKRSDKTPTATTKKLILNANQSFFRLIDVLSTSKNKSIFIQSLYFRNNKKNRKPKVTGNALIHVVDHIIKSRNRGFKLSEIQYVIDSFIFDHIQDGTKKSSNLNGKVDHLNRQSRNLMRIVSSLVEEHQEDI
jgi:hypothetical protein